LVSASLRGEHRLRVCNTEVLREIFGPEEELITAGWRK